MSSVHNLDDGVSEAFEFVLEGHHYLMKYPTTDDMDEIAKETDNDKVNKKLYSYITAVSKDSPKFSDLIRRVSIKKGSRFIAMLQEEIKM